MITYLYWIFVVTLTLLALYGIGLKFKQWPAALITAAVILITSWIAYTFYLEQIFVKRWGGKMSITVPEGQHHMGATWKDDHLWIENYDPGTNICYFTEYARGNVLEGKVLIKNCNPLMPQ